GSGFEQDWHGGRPLSTPFQLEWWAVFKAPNFGRYAWSVEGLQDGRLEIDGSPVEADGRPGEQLLAKGEHALRLSGVVADDRQARLLWQPPGRSSAVVPREALFSPSWPIEGLQASHFRNG